MRPDFDPAALSAAELAERFLPAVIGYARSQAHGSTRWLAEEFESAALVGLARAIATYDPARGPWFHHLKHHVRSELATCRKHYRRHVLRPWPVDDQGGPVPIPDPGAFEPRSDPPTDLWAVAEPFLAGLNPRAREVLRLWCGEGLDYRTIAARMGRSVSSVCRIRDAALAALRAKGAAPLEGDHGQDPCRTRTPRGDDRAEQCTIN